MKHSLNRVLFVQLSGQCPKLATKEVSVYIVSLTEKKKKLNDITFS